MQENNTWKTIIYIILGLVVVIGGIALLSKNKNGRNGENTVIGEANVEEIEVRQMESFPVQVSVLAKGYLPDGCTTLGDAKQDFSGTTFTVTLETRRPLDANCTQVIQNFEKTINLAGVAGLSKGTYTVVVNGVSGAFTLAMDNFIDENDPLK